MKKIITLLAMLPLATGAFAQAITITAADIPLPGDIHNAEITNTVVPTPVPAANATWDYSPYTGGSFLNVYLPETDTFFTNAGVDVFTSVFKTMSPSTGMGYYTYMELDFNASNVQESAIDVLPQAFDLSAFTGNTADSMVIPGQPQRLVTPRVIMKFPFTANSSWSSVSRRVTDFKLTIAAAGLDHAPAQNVYYINRKDTIVGWGKLRVYTPSGPSIPYDVLMDRMSQYTEDSFYLGGMPAPTALLTSFGLAQNQRTDSLFRYNFYRKGCYSYLLSFNYKTDATFSIDPLKYVNTDNLIPAGVNEVNDATFSVVLFPNPSTGSSLNIMLSGKEIKGGSYIITDLTGRTMQTGSLTSQQGVMHIDFTSSFANGNYLVTLLDNNNTKIVTEQFTVTK